MGLPIADRWFELKRIDNDITLLWEPHVIPLMRCNIWHVRGRDRDLMIDTGMGVSSLREAARHLLQKSVTAVATHTHLDHIGSHHEFEDCLAHSLEAENLRRPSSGDSLDTTEWDRADVAALVNAGYAVPGLLVTALPHEGYRLTDYRRLPANPTVLVQEGDIVDIGDRHFEVLHLPGHSPGSIGLWEEASGTLFSGDAVYDGHCWISCRPRTSPITSRPCVACASFRSTSSMAAMTSASAASAWSSSAMGICESAKPQPRRSMSAVTPATGQERHRR
jgi:glyoxylase-like metal-dependent hydrolase (beta-lactamase superfamily II)